MPVNTPAYTGVPFASSGNTSDITKTAAPTTAAVQSIIGPNAVQPDLSAMTNLSGSSPSGAKTDCSRDDTTCGTLDIPQPSQPGSSPLVTSGTGAHSSACSAFSGASPSSTADCSSSRPSISLDFSQPYNFFNTCQRKTQDSMIKAYKYPPRPTAEPLWGSHPDYVTKIKGRQNPRFFGNFGEGYPAKASARQ